MLHIIYIKFFIKVCLIKDRKYIMEWNIIKYCNHCDYFVTSDHNGAIYF